MLENVLPRSLVKSLAKSLIGDSTFTPLDMSVPTTMWIDFDDTDNIDVDAFGIYSATDKTGNGNNWLQSVDAAKLDWNSKGYIAQDATGQSLNTPNSGFTSTATWFATCINIDFNNIAYTSEGVLINCGGFTGGGANKFGPNISYNYVTDTITISWDDNTDSPRKVDLVQGVGFNNGDNLHIVMWNDGTDLNISVNGTEYTDTTGVAQGFSGNTHRVGDFRSGVTYAPVGQLIAGTGIPTSEDISGLMSFLETKTSKWGL